MQKYVAKIQQKDKVIVSYHSDNLQEVRIVLQNLIEQESEPTKAMIIDNDNAKVVFSIAKAA